MKIGVRLEVERFIHEWWPVLSEFQKVTRTVLSWSGKGHPLSPSTKSLQADSANFMFIMNIATVRQESVLSIKCIIRCQTFKYNYTSTVFAETKMGKKPKTHLTLNISKRKKKTRVILVTRESLEVASTLLSPLKVPKTPFARKSSGKRPFTVRSPRQLTFTPTKSPYRKRFKKLEFRDEGLYMYSFLYLPILYIVYWHVTTHSIDLTMTFT